MISNQGCSDERRELPCFFAESWLIEDRLDDNDADLLLIFVFAMFVPMLVHPKIVSLLKCFVLITQKVCHGQTLRTAVNMNKVGS